MKILITVLIAVLVPPLIFCQPQPAPLNAAKIIFNGAYIVMHNKADLVVQNASATALTIKNGGGIISEESSNNVIWNIANDSGYTVPFVATDLAPIPVSFNSSNAAGNGSITFSTYSGVPNFKNSDYLPASVSNVNRNGKDNSNHVIDRFWKISLSDYTNNPHLKNLLFNYRDVEWNEDSNVINEKRLAAQNWNGTKWLANVGTDKAASNYVKVNAANNIFPWWTLVDSNFILKGTGLDFTMQDLIADQQSNQQTTNTFIKLDQNFPNPFSNSTTIHYSISNQFILARIIITNNYGNVLKEINLAVNNGSVNVDASNFIQGAYQYSLYVDGRLIATKQFIVLK